MPIYTANPPPLGQNYFVFNAGESEGPYDLPFIEAMVLSAMLSPEVSVSKDGKTGWQPLTSLVPPAPPRNSSHPRVERNNPPPFQAPAPSKKESHWGRYVLGAVVVIGFIIYASNNSSSAQPAYQPPTTSYQPPPLPVASTPDTSSSFQAPAYTPPAQDTAQPPPQPVYTPPPPSVPAPTPDPTFTVLDSSGRNYRVSQYDYNVLGQKEDEMKKLLGAINRLKASRTEENNLIEADRAALDNTDQAAVDRFNAEVDQYNTSGATLDKWIDSYNGLVQDHNDYLVRVGTPAN